MNLESDRRYFDVSENIESGNSAVTSLTDVEPKAQMEQGNDDYSRIDIIDPITQLKLENL